MSVNDFPFGQFLYKKDGVETCVIMLGGVGNNTVDRYLPRKGVYFRYINYDSDGFFSDAITLFFDIVQMKNNTGQMKTNTGQSQLREKFFARIERLDRIVQVIIDFAKKEPKYKKIVLLGASHGSIIMHNALIRLKMRRDLTLEEVQEIMSRIYLITIGSPNKPPALLLYKYETEILENKFRFYNFYNYKDYVLLNKITHFCLPSTNNPFSKLKEKENIRCFQFRNSIFPHNDVDDVNDNKYSAIGTQYRNLFVYNHTTRISMIIHENMNYMGRGINRENHNHVSPMMIWPFFINDNTEKTITSINEIIELVGTSPDLLDQDRQFDTSGNFTSGLYFSELDILVTLYNIHQYAYENYEGGGNKNQTSKIILKNQTLRKFTVKLDKNNRRKYITTKGSKIYLGDIRGKFKYVF